MYQQIAANKRKTVLLIIIFVLLLGLIGWWADTTWQGGSFFLMGAIIFSGIMTLGSYYQGDRLALWLAGARGPLKKEDNPYLWRLVENLCLTTGLPMPKIYLIPDQALNAFATGRDPQHAAIAVTTGLLKRLENEELEGVLAHELSHIKNLDIRVMTLVSVLVGAVIILSDLLWRSSFFLSNSPKRGWNREGGGNTFFLTIGLLLVIISPIIAQLMKLAISRQREYLADASAALITRYPEGLARALEKIATAAQPLRRASHATAHLFIANPFGSKASQAFHRLFSTHPPIEERIKRLREMAS